MASASDVETLKPASGEGTPAWLVGAVLLAALAAASLFFAYYVPHYLLQYDAASYDVYWPRRFGLLPHLAGGAVALFAGPFQLWTGLRRRWPQVHRWTGRVFLGGVAVGLCGAVYLALTTTFGWAYSVGLMGLAVAWGCCAGVAWYAIRNGDVTSHRRWMIRTYAVTFAFVVARLFDDWLPTSHLMPQATRFANDIWLSWTLPLFIVIVCQGIGGVRDHVRRTAARR